MSLVYLSLGSNLGNRLGFLQGGVHALSDLSDTRVTAVSSVWETDPQGYADQDAFLNIAVSLETALSPEELLWAIHRIEAAAGRERDIRFGPRTLDMDILLYEGVVSSTPFLTLPHPRMRERAFVLVPLLEILPEGPDRVLFEAALTSLPPQGVKKAPFCVRFS